MIANPYYDFIYVIIFSLIGILFIGVALTFSRLIRPKKVVDDKLIAYECGNIPLGGPWVQLRMRYYIFAILMVVFDVEVAFLYPWAVAFRKLGLIPFIEVVIFLAILLVGLVYAWRKGVLKWV
jgi:NADH-quinone oxidoreductase subunit A